MFKKFLDIFIPSSKLFFGHLYLSVKIIASSTVYVLRCFLLVVLTIPKRVSICVYKGLYVFLSLSSVAFTFIFLSWSLILCLAPWLLDVYLEYLYFFTFVSVFCRRLDMFRSFCRLGIRNYEPFSLISLAIPQGIINVCLHVWWLQDSVTLTACWVSNRWPPPAPHSPSPPIAPSRMPALHAELGAASPTSTTVAGVRSWENTTGN